MRNKIFQIMILFMIGGLWVSSCSVIKRIPVETNTEVHYKDSTVITYKDSTIFVEIPKEVVKDVVAQYDTLVMETSVAKSVSFVDTTTHTLKGQLENKSENVIYKTVYLPSEEHMVYRDSIVVKEVPVEVEVVKTKYPKSYWWLLAFFVSALGYAGYKLYRKFRII